MHCSSFTPTKIFSAPTSFAKWGVPKWAMKRAFAIAEFHAPKIAAVALK